MNEELKKCKGFDWGKGNREKNWINHRVSRKEAEQIFFHKPLISGYDEKHSKREERYFVLGKTDLDRLLFSVFTIRKKLIRIISIRDMNKKERKIYNEKIKENT